MYPKRPTVTMHLRADERAVANSIILAIPIIALAFGALLALLTNYTVGTWAWILLAVAFAFILGFAVLVTNIRALGWVGLFLLFVAFGGALATMIAGR